MHHLTGQFQHYAWGSTTAIPHILGREVTQTPVAEYWWGAHASAPSTLLDTDLEAFLRERPAQIGDASVARFGPRLPYLMKLLAADQALSIQAHPTREQAVVGFARENAAGIDMTARERTYKDDWPKPEIIVALTGMEVLYGFRDPHETADLLRQFDVRADLSPVFGPLTERTGEAALAEVFLDVLSLTGDRHHFVDEVVAAAVRKVNDEGPVGDLARTAVELDAQFPGDPGIVAALLLNRIHLPPGQAIFVPAGILHAYIKGLGVEAMANSDNVLRGGLTPKHIDVDELVHVVNFVSTQPTLVEQTEVSPGVFRYVTEAPEFALHRIDVSHTHALPDGGARIVGVVDGDVVATRGDDQLSLRPGDAIFVAAGDFAELTGTGTAFVCMPGV